MNQNNLAFSSQLLKKIGYPQFFCAKYSKNIWKNNVLVFGDILTSSFSHILEKTTKITGFFIYPFNFEGKNNFLYLEFFKNQYGDPYFLFDKSMRCIIDIIHMKLERILTSQNKFLFRIKIHTLSLVSSVSQGEANV